MRNRPAKGSLIGESRYLKLVRYIRHRYARNGYLVISVGGKPSRYSTLGNLAAHAYLAI